MDSVEELMAIYAVMFSSSSENDSDEEKCRPPTKKRGNIGFALSTRRGMKVVLIAQ